MAVDLNYEDENHQAFFCVVCVCLCWVVMTMLVPCCCVLAIGKGGIECKLK